MARRCGRWLVVALFAGCVQTELDGVDSASVLDAQVSSQDLLNLCLDDTLDQDESDVDCGGSCAACTVGRKCRANTDCATDYCEAGFCVDPCNDGKLDGNESDVDCGGSCRGCPLGGTCRNDVDCTSTFCADGVCTDPCIDGRKDSSETDVDCGGVCPKCMNGKDCGTDADCASGHCIRPAWWQPIGPRVCCGQPCGFGTACDPAQSYNGCLCNADTCPTCCAFEGYAALNPPAWPVCAKALEYFPNVEGYSEDNNGQIKSDLICDTGAGKDCLDCGLDDNYPVACGFELSGDPYCAHTYHGCDAMDCPGCCAGQGFMGNSFCFHGDLDTQCGSNAAMCQVCAVGEHCINQKCVALPDGGWPDGSPPSDGGSDGAVDGG